MVSRVRAVVLALAAAACSVGPLAAPPLWAQQAPPITGRITNDVGSPLPGTIVSVRGSTVAAQANREGQYAIRAQPGQVLVFRLIGYGPQERTVGRDLVLNVEMRRAAINLDAQVVTALGQSTAQRNVATAQQSVDGADIVQTTRQNFVNALQGRIAGVEVTSSSGTPGASSQITIRGVSSISSNNQPLMIIDGLPMDNKTLNTGVLASDAPGSTTAFSNRGVDFTNRAADLNPEDIETLVVLKGPEAAALYGIDAANGAIVITTKRGRAGTGGLEYSNFFRYETTRANPNLQNVYAPTTITGGALGSFSYFGAPYPAGTQFFDNTANFFRPAVTQRHSLSFSGAAPEARINYRVATSWDRQEGVVPGDQYRRLNLTGATQAQVTSWLTADLSMTFSRADNDQSYKGAIGPLIGLLVWPRTDNARDFLTPAGLRRRVTLLAGSGEVDNPFFNVEKNRVNSVNSRLIMNLGLVIAPWSWSNIKMNIGQDGYTNENFILRHPESAAGFNTNGVLDLANDITRNLTAQTLFNVNPIKLGSNFTLNGTLGNQISDFSSEVDALKGQDFLDPNFGSINNTNLRFNRTTLAQRRLISFFGTATLAYRNYLYLNVTGRNDRTSTIPVERNSFFYPSVSGAFVLSDAVPAIGRMMTAKLRAAYAEVGKDARPYAYRPALEFKTTAYGGYGYGFTGPNLNLRPEFATSWEAGGEFGFFGNRLGLDVTTYRKQTRDQIVNDIRGSYGTGFILFNLNGAVTRNEGIEISVRGTPLQRRALTWDVLVNFEQARGRVLALPNALPESYVSDTWLYENVRNGTAPGLSTRSLTGLFYLRNNQGKLLIDPTTGLPIRSTTFIDGGYDRQPKYTIGISNTLRTRRLSLSFLVDLRRGGDVFNATEHYLTTRGLSARTLDREQARIVPGVLRDGKENTANPTPNSIVVVPAVNNQFYTSMSEELFIEKNIHWLRLRDITLRYELPGRFLTAREASVFITGTDLLILTNYSGFDPIVNGNTAAVGGSGAAGVDFGNFPMPRGITFGLKLGL